MIWACNGRDDTPCCVVESSLRRVLSLASGLPCFSDAETLPRRDETQFLESTCAECHLFLFFFFLFLFFSEILKKFHLCLYFPRKLLYHSSSLSVSGTCGAAVPTTPLSVVEAHVFFFKKKKKLLFWSVLSQAIRD